MAFLYLLLFTPLVSAAILHPHISYPLFGETPKASLKYIKETIDKTDIPMPRTPPSVIVIPGFNGGSEADRGLAASLKTVRDNIDRYDTILIVGGYYPETCGETTPLYPLVVYTGDHVHTHLGDWTVDADLRSQFWAQTGGRPGMDYNYLIEQSELFDQPFFWLRALFPPGKTPQTKVLPIVLYATLRNQVQLAAQTLNNLLFQNDDGVDDTSAYGKNSEGKRYLLIIPITISSGVDLYQNVYIENILTDITMRNSVTEFEQWLYYLSGTTGATFSRTVASQILVVRLAALAAGLSDDKGYNERAETSDNGPRWKWCMLDYYTSFDHTMNRTKMVTHPYYHTYYSGIDVSNFTEIDNPTGHRIYYSMALSKEPSLQRIVTHSPGAKKKRHIAKLPTPVAFTGSFSNEAMDFLMENVRAALRGEKVSLTPTSVTRQTIPAELYQLAPYSIRVYILAEHSAEYEELKKFERKKRNSSSGSGSGSGSNKAKSRTGIETKIGTANTEQAVISDSLRSVYNHGQLGDMCMETILFEILNSDFFPNEGIYTSLIKQATAIYSERLSTNHIQSLLKTLRAQYKALIAEGALPKSSTRDIDIDVKRSLVVEVSIYHSWEYTNVFQLTEAKGHFVVLWDGRHAVCEMPENRPDGPATIFFRLTQCALRNGLDPWDWQRGIVHTYDRTRYTANVHQRRTKDEL